MKKQTIKWREDKTGTMKGQIGYTWSGARGVTVDRGDVMEGRLELGLER